MEGFKVLLEKNRMILFVCHDRPKKERPVPNICQLVIPIIRVEYEILFHKFEAILLGIGDICCIPKRGTL